MWSGFLYFDLSKRCEKLHENIKWFFSSSFGTVVQALYILGKVYYVKENYFHCLQSPYPVGCECLEITS